MTLPLPTPAALTAGITALELAPDTAPIRELVAWLKLQKTLAYRPTIHVVPDEHSDYLWHINDTPLPAARRSTAFWTFWMALRDGWADCGWSGIPPSSLRNSRQRIVEWLERQGHRALAAEVRKCRITAATVVYDRTGSSPRIVFD